MGTTSCLNGVSTGARRPGPGTVSGPGDPPCGGCPGRAGGDRVHRQDAVQPGPGPLRCGEREAGRYDRRWFRLGPAG